MADGSVRIPRVVVIGAGGHARVVIDALTQTHDANDLAILDSDERSIGTSVLGVDVIGTDDLLEHLARSGTTGFVVGVAGARDNTVRRRLFERARALGLNAVTAAHPRAIVSQWADCGVGVQLMAGAIVNACASLGDNVIVNSGAIVEHDCRIASHVHVATGARLTGGVIVEEAAHIGAGAVIRQLVTIGERAVVGAGSVVVKDVPPDTVVAGVPAKELT